MGLTGILRKISVEVVKIVIFEGVRCSQRDVRGLRQFGWGEVARIRKAEPRSPTGNFANLDNKQGRD